VPAEKHPSPIVGVAATGAIVDDTALGFLVGLTEDFIVGDLVLVGFAFAVGAQVGIPDGRATTGSADGIIEELVDGIIDGITEGVSVGT